MNKSRREAWVFDAAFRRTTGHIVRETLIVVILLLAAMVIHLAIGVYQVVTLTPSDNRSAILAQTAVSQHASPPRKPKPQATDELQVGEARADTSGVATPPSFSHEEQAVHGDGVEGLKGVTAP